MSLPIGRDLDYLKVPSNSNRAMVLWKNLTKSSGKIHFCLREAHRRDEKRRHRGGLRSDWHIVLRTLNTAYYSTFHLSPYLLIILSSKALHTIKVRPIQALKYQIKNYSKRDLILRNTEGKNSDVAIFLKFRQTIVFLVLLIHVIKNQTSEVPHQDNTL